jgi:hypothetical protein
MVINITIPDSSKRCQALDSRSDVQKGLFGKCLAPGHPYNKLTVRNVKIATSLKK